MDLTERKKQILKIVVEEYIHTAEPVGSKIIAERMGGAVSSATIRNELGSLTEMGCLEQPHTSAGRIPTPVGYRVYVDELMERQRLSAQETEEINASLRMKLAELDGIISRAGRAVSSFTNYPAYAAAAGRQTLTAKRFDLLPVDEGTCIVVMMYSGNRVKSQLLRMQLKVELEQFPMLTNLLNTHFTGISSAKMGTRLMDLSAQLPPAAFLLLSQAVSAASDTLDAGRRVITAGAKELLKLPEFRDAEKAHSLMSVLEKGSLPLPEDEGPMKILIGPENVSEALKNASVVVASYDIGDDMRGLIGVVGPTRMDYATVAARLTGFAEGLTRLFGQHQLPPKEEEEP